MSSYQLAHLNIAIMRFPETAPEMTDFVNNLDPINALADRSPGFIWRLQDEEDEVVAARVFGDGVLVNISVWENLESLRLYVFKSAHAEIMSRRQEWFSRSELASSVLWWVPEGTQPSMEEAAHRLQLLRNSGPSEEAFSFRKSFLSP